MTQVKTTTILVYRGQLNYETIEEILSQYKEDIQPFDAEPVVRKRIYSILVECLENTFKHKALKKNGFKHSPVELYLKEKDDSFEIKIGNYIHESNIDVLVDKIAIVNSLDKDGLNKLYRESISKARISDKGGAGLGIIEIARNARQDIKYEISPAEANHVFFSMVIYVKKQ